MLLEIKVPVARRVDRRRPLLQWHKQLGDRIDRGEPSDDLETDKVTLEITAPAEGSSRSLQKRGRRP